jgi:cytochrome c biogenesis protein CcmG/thiol:disulfide interchange protein DsbE
VLEHAQHRLAAHGGTVLGVTYQTAIPDAEKFERTHGITYPSLRDVGSKLAEDYGTDKLPETFIIDRQGRITAVRRAQLDARWLRAHLDPLLAGS